MAIDQADFTSRHRRRNIRIRFPKRDANADATVHIICVMSEAEPQSELKFDTYFLSPNSKVTVRLFNGSFQKSDGAVARDRLRDVSLVKGGEITHPQTESWRDEGKTALLDLETGEAGTYVVGVSTKHREIDLKAKDFNEYLAHDGLPDTLATLRRNNELGKDVRERYSKHVRAIFQVGGKLTEDYKRPLGYPVEIIPHQNPYALRRGQTLEVLCMLDGQPIVNQFVMAGWEPKKGKARSLTARTDAKGIARLRLPGAGRGISSKRAKIYSKECLREPHSVKISVKTAESDISLSTLHTNIAYNSCCTQ